MIVPAATTPPDALFAWISWHLLPLLFVSYLISLMDRSNISHAAVQMNADPGFSAAV